jgi:hypothetical protein
MAVQSPLQSATWADHPDGASLVIRWREIQAKHARQRAREAAREADAAECLLWSEQMEGFGDGRATESPGTVSRTATW